MGCSSAVCSLYDETITVTLLVVDECDNHAKALLVEFASCRFCQFKFLVRSFPTLIFYRCDRYAAAGSRQPHHTRLKVATRNFGTHNNRQISDTSTADPTLVWQ